MAGREATGWKRTLERGEGPNSVGEFIKTRTRMGKLTKVTAERGTQC